MAISSHTLARLRDQMARAELILFTGAGFSLSANARGGGPLPSTDQLCRELWELCFPSDPPDPKATIGDLFHIAIKRRKRDLERLFESRLSVDTDSLPDFYQLYFNLPWLRAYSLNVDDLAEGVFRRFALRRSLNSISATQPDRTYVPRSRYGDPYLEVVHLNGVLPGPLESLTFSDTQYAQRIAQNEPWYARCVADVTCRPVIFIGTELREVPLWQHMELRKRRMRGGVDRRPGSVLVTPSLSASRRELLEELRIEWVEGTAESFAVDVLSKLSDAANRGFECVGEWVGRAGRAMMPLVSDLMSERPNLATEYLLGEEPHWSDLITERAIRRTHDKVLLQLAQDILNGKRKKTALAITGTAGSGKSTALMNLAVTLSVEGIPVFWVDRNSDVAPSTIRNQIRKTRPKLVLAIDDADLLGRDLTGLLLDLVPSTEHILFVFAVRSGKLDPIAHRVSESRQLSLEEHGVPGLTNDDIEELIAVLDRHHRLGILKGLGDAARRRAFAGQAGRQLLVAMIQATSGERFEDKARQEVVELEGELRNVYGLICVASALRHYLTKDEILIAVGGESQADAVAALERLVARHLIIARPPAYFYQARHRVVANLVMEKLQQIGELGEILAGLAFAAAVKVNPAMSRQSRPWRFVASTINHGFLGRVLGPMGARRVYTEVENVLSSDYHYWLQRGSLEVERGDVKLAEQFLNQALSLAPDDFMVLTEYGYLLMRKAEEHPELPKAEEFLNEGIATLEGVIASRGSMTPYPFHVLGSQGLQWSRVGRMHESERREFLKRVSGIVDRGLELHPWSKELQGIHKELERATLLTVVRDNPEK